MPSLISMKILGTAHHGIVNYRTIRYHNSALGNSVWFSQMTDVTAVYFIMLVFSQTF